MKVWHFAAACFLLGAIDAPSASAQYGLSGGVIAGTGTVSIERMPEAMRMSVTLSAKGKDLKEALAAIKDRTEAAKTQLAALGADKASLKVESPKITAEASNQQRRQMEMMMMERMRGGPGGAKKPKKEEKPPVNVSVTLTASWPLKAKEPEELLISATAIQEKIKAADLGGLKDVKLSPEEEEAMAEMEASGGYSQYGEEGPKPGEPSFHFYAAITDAEREKALAEAFVKAKEHAARIAKAASAELGKLASLNETEAGVDSDDYRGLSSGDRYAYQMMQQMQGMRRGDTSAAAEGIGMHPDKVSYRVSVHASFELKSP